MFPQVAVSSHHKENNMAVILLATGLSLLIQGCWSSVGQTESGCMTWTNMGHNVCCGTCHPGNRLVQKCGPNPKDLCTPCESGTFTMEPQADRCARCTQCVGAQVLKEVCTATTDTKCGCKEGHTCGVENCSFCVETCGKGQEPTEERSCRPCPNGTFNDQIHQKCKPWSTKCLDQDTVVKGDAFTDIECVTSQSVKPDPKSDPKNTEEWPVALSVVPIVLMAFIIIIMIIAVAVKYIKKRSDGEKKPEETKKTPIIRTPTDDPRTLIAIECSFHEAQQEQGSSSESLDSKESTDQLLV